MPIIICILPASKGICTGYHPSHLPPSTATASPSTYPPVLSRSCLCSPCFPHPGCLSLCSSPTTAPTTVNGFKALFQIFPTWNTTSKPHPSASLEFKFAGLWFSEFLVTFGELPGWIPPFCRWVFPFIFSTYPTLRPFSPAVCSVRWSLLCTCFLPVGSAVPGEVVHFRVQGFYLLIPKFCFFFFGFPPSTQKSPAQGVQYMAQLTVLGFARSSPFMIFSFQSWRKRTPTALKRQPAGGKCAKQFDGRSRWPCWWKICFDCCWDPPFPQNSSTANFSLYSL